MVKNYVPAQLCSARRETFSPGKGTTKIHVLCLQLLKLCCTIHVLFLLKVVHVPLLAYKTTSLYYTECDI